MEGVDSRYFKNLNLLNITLSLISDYRYWINIDKQGRFKNIKEGGVILKDATTKFIGVFNKDKSDVYRGVFFILGEIPEYSLAQIHYNTDERRLIYWVNLNRNSFSNSNNNNLLLFEAYIKIVNSIKESKGLIEEQKKKEILRRGKLKNLYSLTKSNIKIFLDFGQGRIYWKDKEITDGFGFYTSILANGFWHDSRNVLWKIEKIDDSTLLAKGYWIDLPLFQIWKVKLIGDNLIEWNVELVVDKKVKLNKVQANVMLNKEYKGSNFKILKATSRSTLLPRHIKFILNDNNSLCCKGKLSDASFLNSKDIVLRYDNVLKKCIQPGRYNYFIGKIIIEEKLIFGRID